MDTRGFNEKDIMSSLDGIAEAISSGGGGGSSLPEVTSDDNGKVLTVVNGAWDKANASGGGGDVFVINGTVNGLPQIDTGSANDIELADLNVSELNASVNNNERMVFKLVDSSFYNQTTVVELNNISEVFEDGYYLFTALTFVLINDRMYEIIQLNYNKDALEYYDSTVVRYSIGPRSI